MLPFIRRMYIKKSCCALISHSAWHLPLPCCDLWSKSVFYPSILLGSTESYPNCQFFGLLKKAGEHEENAHKLGGTRHRKTTGLESNPQPSCWEGTVLITAPVCQPLCFMKRKQKTTNKKQTYTDRQCFRDSKLASFNNLLHYHYQFKTEVSRRSVA